MSFQKSKQIDLHDSEIINHSILKNNNHNNITRSHNNVNKYSNNKNTNITHNNNHHNNYNIHLHLDLPPNTYPNKINKNNETKNSNNRNNNNKNNKNNIVHHHVHNNYNIHLHLSPNTIATATDMKSILSGLESLNDTNDEYDERIIICRWHNFFIDEDAMNEFDQYEYVHYDITKTYDERYFRENHRVCKQEIAAMEDVACPHCDESMQKCLFTMDIYDDDNINEVWCAGIGCKTEHQKALFGRHKIYHCNCHNGGYDLCEKCSNIIKKKKIKIKNKNKPKQKTIDYSSCDEEDNDSKMEIEADENCGDDDVAALEHEKRNKIKKHHSNGNKTGGKTKQGT